MRTRRQLEKYLKENKVIYESRNEESMDDYEHDWSFHVNGKKENLKAEWFGGKDYIAITGGIILNIGIRRAPYCCGVYEIGDFTNGDRYPHIWEAIIEYFLLVSRLPYLRTETITKSGTTQAVEIALMPLVALMPQSELVQKRQATIGFAQSNICATMKSMEFEFN